MYFLVHFCIKILLKTKKILIIIQRSNGDVFLGSPLIKALFEYYKAPQIDLLVNDDTYLIANLVPHINLIYQFSYKKKIDNRWQQEKELIKNIFRKYDLSINLTASDRSVFYSLLASKKSISAVEKDKLKSWWKRLFLSYHYYFDSSKHILINNSEPLNCLKIKHQNIQNPPTINDEVILNIKRKLRNEGIIDFAIFHPSAQYNYKIYPQPLRNKLLKSLSTLGLPILITGSSSKIDLKIKQEIPIESNIYNFIGKTSLEEYFALSQLSSAYIGMDTLNMHIAASQNKPIFAIFGPTNLNMWSPWSNTLQKAAKTNKPIQSYDNITIFQSSSPCEVCGLVGCGSNHGKNEFPYEVTPEEIFNEVKKWYKKMKN
jgi:heptosyltransferase III